VQTLSKGWLSLILNKKNGDNYIFQTIFKEELLPHFLTVLLQSLVDKNHGLLQDEVVGALYSMAAVDFEFFYMRFIPSFLASNQSLDDSQKQTLATNLKPESVCIN